MQDACACVTTATPAVSWRAGSRDPGLAGQAGLREAGLWTDRAAGAWLCFTLSGAGFLRAPGALCSLALCRRWAKNSCSFGGSKLPFNEAKSRLIFCC